MPPRDYLGALKLGSGRNTTRDPLIAIVISIIIASVLVVYPLPYAVAAWRPLFFLLVTLFWVLCQPAWCGIWFAFFIGLASDLILDAMLGQYALSFVIIAFFARYFTRNKRVLTFTNLWIVVVISLFLHLLIQLFLQEMAGIQFSIIKHWQPLWTSIAIWPVICFLLKPWRES